MLASVEDTLGADTLNCFCKEIVRKALVSAAGLDDEESRDNEWRRIFAQLQETAARVGMKVPQRIEILRGVAMMQCRIAERGSKAYEDGMRVLKESAELSDRFYGPQSQTSTDIKRQFC